MGLSATRRIAIPEPVRRGGTRMDLVPGKGTAMSAMHRLFARWRRRDAPAGHMDRAYVSEFTHFIDDFVRDHPEVVRDQKKGFRIYWDKQVDLTAEAQARADTVPDDGYGFYNSAWGRPKH